VIINASIVRRIQNSDPETALEISLDLRHPGDDGARGRLVIRSRSSEDYE
jgi:hypothetical protein